jgi:pimeloyl-ACP methyl ester carboxylesterase
MGGYVAMYLAKHHPSFVDKIITLATKFYWDEITAAKEIKMLEAETILQKIPGFAAQLRNRHHPNDWKIVLSKTRDMLVQLGRNNTLQIEDYKSIFAPSLLLLGDRDNMVTVEETMAVQKALANGKFRTLANTAHPIEHADTEMLASIVTGFMI